LAEPTLTDLAIILQDTLSRIDNLVFTTGAPADELGTINSVALDVAAKVLYGPKTALGWGPGTALTGADGRDPEFRASGGYLQVRLTGDVSWSNLIPIADLPEGPAGPTPVISIGTVTTAPTGDPAEASLGGTAEEPVLNLTLPRGGKGDGGPAAWSPVIAAVADGARRVWQIVDWTGGGGAKPATGFIGPTGLVATAAEATDVRGPGGAGTGDMIAANNLSDLTDDAAARTNLDVYSKAETDDAAAAAADPKADAAAVIAALGLKADKADIYTKAQVDALIPVFATKEEVWAGTAANKVVPPSVLKAALEFQSLALASNVATMNCHAGINFTVPQLTANATLANPTNKVDGRDGKINFSYDASARTLSLGSDWKKFAASPPIPTAANSKFTIVYSIIGTDVFYSVLVKP
jgi:hypothetical protein